MLKERGRVVSVSADGIWVETLQKAACDTCSAKAGCGQRLLASSVMKNMSQIKATVPEGGQRIWSVGDYVEIGMEEDALVSATFFAYLIPLFALVLGALFGHYVGQSDAFAVAGAAIGLGFGGFVSRVYSFRQSVNHRYHAIVLGESPSLSCP